MRRTEMIFGLMSFELFLTLGVLTIAFAVLPVPIPFTVAERQQLAPWAMMVSIALTAPMAVIPPIGYQTNLMVYGPGNYRFLDITRVGGLLQVLLWIVVPVVAPLIWPL